ncbi:hypothetical protein GCM10027290_59650 [Micromonospora sonneratiae]|uniref:Uncharacterized protein n=1 Tax=Micromonospora sonneratiae TaxID=1184706 RepID=A0ABW3Y8J9_9ACTN
MWRKHPTERLLLPGDEIHVEAYFYLVGPSPYHYGDGVLHLRVDDVREDDLGQDDGGPPPADWIMASGVLIHPDRDAGNHRQVAIRRYALPTFVPEPVRHCLGPPSCAWCLNQPDPDAVHGCARHRSNQLVKPPPYRSRCGCPCPPPPDAPAQTPPARLTRGPAN